jgi:hypothetical protein
MKNPLSFPARLIVYPVAVAASITLIAKLSLGVPLSATLAVLMPLGIELLLGYLGLD